MRETLPVEPVSQLPNAADTQWCKVEERRRIEEEKDERDDEESFGGSQMDEEELSRVEDKITQRWKQRKREAWASEEGLEASARELKGLCSICMVVTGSKEEHWWTFGPDAWRVTITTEALR